MKKKIIALMLVVAMVAVSVISATLAYFTDTEEATNVFTVGDVDIILHDENADGTDFKQSPNMVPNKTVDKVVYVENASNLNNAYIRVKLLVPTGYENVLLLQYTDYVGEGTYWGEAEISTVTRDGKTYTQYTYTPATALEATKSTYNLIEAVKMNSTFKWVKDSGNKKFYVNDRLVELDEEREFEVIVLAEAVQADGFSSATEAFSKIDIPIAIVTDADEYENTPISWSAFGPFDALGSSYQLESVYTFTAQDTVEEAQNSPYAEWWTDYYVSLDRDLGQEQILLGGNYGSYGWVGFTNGDIELPANEKIGLLGAATGTLGWPYEDIVALVGEFKCGVAMLDPALNGATFTVELRITNPDDPNEYYIIESVDYVLGSVEVGTAEDFEAAITDGASQITLAAGTYKMPSTTGNNTITIKGTKDTVIDNTLGSYLDNSTISFEGVTIKGSTGYANGNGSDYAALYSPNVTYTNCTFDGPFRIGRDGAKFINCTFTNLGNDYVWTYGNDVTFIGCTFESDGKALLIYSDGGSEVSTVVVKDCTFNATKGATAGAISNQNCAAIEIQNYGNGVNLTTSGNTIDSDFSGEWRIKTYHTGNPKVIVNGTEYTQTALDGTLLTVVDGKVQ